MRDILNNILLFIGAPQLTDAEYATLSYMTGETPATTVFTELLRVVDSREGVSGVRDRLQHYFLAKGVAIPLDGQTSSTSKILVGWVLT